MYGKRNIAGIQKIDWRWVPIIKNKLIKNHIFFLERKKYRAERKKVKVIDSTIKLVLISQTAGKSAKITVDNQYEPSLNNNLEILLKIKIDIAPKSMAIALTGRTLVITQRIPMNIG